MTVLMVLGRDMVLIVWTLRKMPEVRKLGCIRTEAKDIVYAENDKKVVRRIKIIMINRKKMLKRKISWNCSEDKRGNSDILQDPVQVQVKMSLIMKRTMKTKKMRSRRLRTSTIIIKVILNHLRKMMSMVKELKMKRRRSRRKLKNYEENRKSPISRPSSKDLGLLTKTKCGTSDRKRPIST